MVWYSKPLAARIPGQEAADLATGVYLTRNQHQPALLTSNDAF